MAFDPRDIALSGPQVSISSLGRISKMQAVSIEGLTEVEENLRTFIDQIVTAGHISMQKQANKILEHAKRLVPYDEGDLFSTGRVVKAFDPKTGRFIKLERGSFYVTFGGISKREGGKYVDYAMIIHENPMHWQFNQEEKKSKWPPQYPGPKSDHYLEIPAFVARATMLGEVSRDIEAAAQTSLQQLKPRAYSSMFPRLITTKRTR